MSETPRMDAVVKPFIGNLFLAPKGASDLLEKGRELERELNAAKARIAELELQIKQHNAPKT